MKGGTVARVATLPPCDICKDRGVDPTPKAQYDARMMAGPWKGTWAYLCEDDWKSFTNQTLGTGVGQRLEVAP